MTLGAVGQWDDAELLARFVAAGRGEPLDDPAELAFAAIVDRHGPAVLRVARSILGDEASSLDAFQATFLILAQKARTLRVDHSLAPWLASVARRVALGSRKARARRARLEQRAARPEATDESPSGHHARAETVRAIVAEVDRLPEPFRSAVVACHLDGLTQQAAAKYLGWPIGTLQSRLDRGRQKLRDRLTRRGLAPTSLAILPPTGLIPTLPATLATTTARTAVLWAIGSTSPTLIAPSVLAILQPSMKGMIMANLKVGTLVLGTAIAAAGSAWTLGVGSSDGSGDKPVTVPNPVTSSASSNAVKGDGVSPATVAPDGYANAPARIEDVDIHGFKYPAPADLLSAAGHSTLASNQTDPSSRSDKEPPIQDDSPVRKVAKKPVLLELKPNDPEMIPLAADGPDLPTLLCFMTSGGNLPGPQETPSLDQLKRLNYPVRTLDLTVAHDVATRYKIDSFPAYILINGSGEKLGQLMGGVESGGIKTKQLAEFYNLHRPKAVSASETKEPPLTIPAVVPRPWETAVRIKVQYGSSVGFGSGTIISNSPTESIVLTSAGLLVGDWGSRATDRTNFPALSIDLFGGQLSRDKPGQFPCTKKDLPAELVAFDPYQDIALVRFHPGEILSASPIVQANWEPNGEPLITTGCSYGNDVTAWDTTIFDFATRPTNFISERAAAIRCQTEPAPARSGGGLFTREGYLVGVLSWGEPSSRSGIYVGPSTIHNFLRKVKQDQVGIELAVNLTGRLPRRESTTDTNPIFVKPGSSSVVPPKATRGTPEKSPDLSPTQLEPISPPSVSNQEQRLADLERKLDRVLQSLDNIRGELGPVRAKGGLGP